MKVKEIMQAKGKDVFSVGPDNSLLYAIRLANEQKIGALLVLDDDNKLEGIITERDILRECDKRNGIIDGLKVEEVMTKNLIIGVPDDDVQYLMGVMTKNRIRHLPIMDGDKVAGILSIGDAVKSLLDESEYQNRYLTQYIQSG